MEFQITGLFVLLALVHVAEAALSGRLPREVVPYKPAQFDVFKLILRNRAGFCTINRCKELTAGNVYPLWTIEGLAPSFSDGTDGPTHCLSNAKFNASALRSILPQLGCHWPSYTSASNELLWSKQFAAYGTCAITDDSNAINATLQYFQMTLDAYEKNDVASWLQSSNITPCDSVPYPHMRVFYTVGGNFGQSIELHCNGSRNGIDILQEIRLCVDKRTLTPSHCLQPISSCRTNHTWYLESSADLSTASVFLAIAAIAFALLVWRGFT
ncbi:ribonuclease Oy-like [Tropilaelaps mercedesae]|uniref:Ribonuclease Oy-like n=1 Tax=Tropilaelaps mercedesae TaxID=418985 RepID=A0A1V9Y2C0_9ACAR|nr:ribonuclease Oy-like [Tropilaelaps mercedesae]